MNEIDFLQGVPVDHVMKRLLAAGGNELGSGKLSSPESSAALAVNTFGFFIERPEALPPFPGADLGFPALRVDVEYCARFPWSGGTHPWLDAVVETSVQLIGVESKRYEPYRDSKEADFSDAYDRKVWGSNMGPFEAMRDDLRRSPRRFRFLDAAQLVKHSFGLVTDGERHGKEPWLLYVYAEPAHLAGKAITDETRKAHRDEIANFASAVAGAAVQFHSISYRAWLASWPERDDIQRHARAVIDRFAV